MKKDIIDEVKRYRSKQYMCDLNLNKNVIVYQNKKKKKNETTKT